jgi:hypothetical protein
MRNRIGRTSLLAVSLAATLGVLTIGAREAFADDASRTAGCLNICTNGGNNTDCAICCIENGGGEYFGGMCVLPSNFCICTT